MREIIVSFVIVGVIFAIVNWKVKPVYRTVERPIVVEKPVEKVIIKEVPKIIEKEVPKEVTRVIVKKVPVIKEVRELPNSFYIDYVDYQRRVHTAYISQTNGWITFPTYIYAWRFHK